MFKKSLKQVSLQGVLIISSICAVLPFLYMIATALTEDTFTMPYPPILIPKTFYVGNFIEAWTSSNFSRYFLNSFFVASVTTIAALFISTLSAYGFAKMKFKGKNIVFNLYLFSMMIPTILALVSQYTVINSLGLVDTYTGLLLLYVSGVFAVNTFFLKGFFEGLPKELEESILIDGGSKWTVYRHIILPLSKPALGTLAIMTFSGTWDEFFAALTIIKTESMRTLPVALKLFQGQQATKWGLVFAASLIALIPILIIFITFQKSFLKTGATEGAVKG
jgi:multiple sugar transport system permease protein